MLRFAASARGTSPTLTTVADKSEIGSTWGVAYNRSTASLYAAAFLKRHVGLGPNGLGAIYEIPNVNGTAGTPTLLIDVSTVAGVDVGTIGSNAARGLTGAPSAPSADPTAFPLVGKIGLGDIDISDDSTTLYTINLNERTLLSIPIAAPATLTEYPIPTDYCADPDDTRPFAAKYYRGSVYVGVTCDGTSTNNRADLKAGIYEFDPVAGTFNSTPVLDIPLNYTKGASATPCGSSPIPTRWNVWTDTATPAGPHVSCAALFGIMTYPQPLLTDIEFDVDGSMILGFFDLWGHQLGEDNQFPNGTGGETAVTGGEILRAYNNNGTFVLESNGTAGPLTGSAGNSQGPGGGEFYSGDNQLVNAISNHLEIGNGGLALLPGSGQLASTAMDAAGSAYTGGVRYFSNTNGSGNSGSSVQLYTNGTGNFGKAHGLGDLEFLCDEAPIEIGNRVWRDTNGNGVQDPGEPGVSGITVSRQGPTNTVTAVTDANGLYYFSQLRPNTAYTLTINPAVAALSGLGLTTPNAVALSGASVSSNHPISDTRDSDAVLVSSQARIVYTTGNAGQNNHGLDFGFSPVVGATVRITNTPPGGFTLTKEVTTTDGSTPVVSGNFAIVVNCVGLAGYPSTQLLAARGTIAIGNLPAGTVCALSEDMLTLPTAPAGYNWLSAQVTPSSLTIGGNVTATVTAVNTLAPVPSSATNVLTVTKSISGTGSGPFDLTITGPGGYITNTTIDTGGDGDRRRWPLQADRHAIDARFAGVLNAVVIQIIPDAVADLDGGFIAEQFEIAQAM